jgi:hypothetical protein
MSQAVQQRPRHLTKQRNAILAAIGATVAAGAVAIAITTGGNDSTTNESVSVPPAPAVSGPVHADESGVANAINPSVGSLQSRPDESNVANAITPSDTGVSTSSHPDESGVANAITPSDTGASYSTHPDEGSYAFHR